MNIGFILIVNYKMNLVILILKYKMNFDATYIFILKYKNKYWYYFNSKIKKKELMLF